MSCWLIYRQLTIKITWKIQPSDKKASNWKCTFHSVKFHYFLLAQLQFLPKFEQADVEVDLIGQLLRFVEGRGDYWLVLSTKTI